MKTLPQIGLADVRAVYSGPEGQLWELAMGEQIHIGGLTSSMELAEKAGIRPGTKGVDLCCCTGAGMRFLVLFRKVSNMTGVDATSKVVQIGKDRCRRLGLAERIDFIEAEVTDSGLPDDSADFVWGEDAWCYVADKPRLIAEAVRITRPGGVIAFTDWVEGPNGLPEQQAARFMRFMKFPTLASIADYKDLLTKNGCKVLHAGDTGRFARYMDLYLDMLRMQLTYDALRIIGFDQDLMGQLSAELEFMQQLAHAGKIAQGLFVARKG
ncbi:MAG: methyltransferase domain-containing protein [Sedimentisphaerales bacterium]|nr:methyltransferase domain-containing protein [Sedimentisphaerales bacterium]